MTRTLSIQPRRPGGYPPPACDHPGDQTGTVTGRPRTLAGSWNAMVTHRVTVQNPADVDPELIRWTRSAYEGTAA